MATVKSFNAEVSKLVLRHTNTQNEEVLTRGNVNVEILTGGQFTASNQLIIPHVVDGSILAFIRKNL